MAFGAAVFAHNSKGSASCPIWAFRAALSLVCIMALINEYNTSKMCHRCRSCRVRGVHVKGDKGELHGVRYCSLCRLRINRDINAAKNMLYVFYHQLARCGVRPLGYTPAKRVVPEAAIGRRLRKLKAMRAAKAAKAAEIKAAQQAAAEQAAAESGAFVAAEAAAGATPPEPATAAKPRTKRKRKRANASRKHPAKDAGSDSSGDGE